MTWYSAHIVSYAKFLDGVQDKYPLWENVVLIEANSVDAAYEKAEGIGKATYEDTADGGGGMSWDNRPALWVFAGIRKLVECRDTPYTLINQTDGEEDTPAHGTEVTYSEFEVQTDEDLARLVSGDAVSILYKM